MDPLIDWGIQLIQSLQAAGPAFDAPMAFFTFLGTIEFYLLLLPFVYWNVNPRIGFRLLIVLIATDAISSGLKHLLRQPRPYWVGEVTGKSTELTYGIPSSHASDSLAVWGYLGMSFRRAWLWILAILLIFFIALSRLYLGVHFPHDIAGGWLIGLLVLLVFSSAATWVGARVGQAQLGLQILAALIGCSLIGVLGAGIGAAVRDLADPPAWASFSREARSLTHYFTIAGASFGAIAGYAVLSRKVAFDAGGPWYLKILRYLLGIIGVFLIWQGLDAAFSTLAPDESAMGYILRFVRYSGTTLWAMLGAPFVFIKLRLANETKNSAHPVSAAPA